MPDQPIPDSAPPEDADDFAGIPDLDAWLAFGEIATCLTRLASLQQGQLDLVRRRLCVAVGELVSACDEVGVPATSVAPEQGTFPLLTHLIYQTAPDEVIAIAERGAAGASDRDLHSLVSWLQRVTQAGQQ